MAEARKQQTKEKILARRAKRLLPTIRKRRLSTKILLYFLGVCALLDLILFLIFYYILDRCYGILCLF